MQTWSQDNVRQERTGWRCEAISQRHRQWGYNCPAVDLDFVMAEYNYGKPCALIEYKEKQARMPSLDHPTYIALSDLANNYVGVDGGLPFFLVFYCSNDWWFRMIPVNKRASDFLTSMGAEKGRNLIDTPIPERWFVYLLYRLRKESLTGNDLSVIKRLSAELPGYLSEAA